VSAQIQSTLPFYRLPPNSSLAVTPLARINKTQPSSGIRQMIQQFPTNSPAKPRSAKGFPIMPVAASLQVNAGKLAEEYLTYIQLLEGLLERPDGIYELPDGLKVLVTDLKGSTKKFQSKDSLPSDLDIPEKGFASSGYCDIFGPRVAGVVLLTASQVAGEVADHIHQTLVSQASPNKKPVSKGYLLSLILQCCFTPGDGMCMILPQEFDLSQALGKAENTYQKVDLKSRYVQFRPASPGSVFVEKRTTNGTAQLRIVVSKELDSYLKLDERKFRVDPIQSSEPRIGNSKNCQVRQLVLPVPDSSLVFAAVFSDLDDEKSKLLKKLLDEHGFNEAETCRELKQLCPVNEPNFLDHVQGFQNPDEGNVFAVIREAQLPKLLEIFASSLGDDAFSYYLSKDFHIALVHNNHDSGLSAVIGSASLTLAAAKAKTKAFHRCMKELKLRLGSLNMPAVQLATLVHKFVPANLNKPFNVEDYYRRIRMEYVLKHVAQNDLRLSMSDAI
jgi:hypothetical protein